MPQLLIYKTTAELPAHFFYQKESFVRMLWVDVDDFDIESGWEEEAAHFVVADRKKLISYAAVVDVELTLNGNTYRCGGVSSVMTYPALRKQGYGGQVVKAATDYILSSGFDFGLLWTEHDKFYEKYGWEVMAGLTTLTGNPQQPKAYDDEIRMMIFASEKAKQNRKAFESGELYIGSHHW